MSRVKQFIDQDVLTAAKARIGHIYDTHDTVAVCFSGGKDSLVALHLTHEVAVERGERLPMPVIFRDEELIPMTVIDFVASYRDVEWCDLRWYCIPLASTKFILGRNHEYVQWDPSREHVRPMPEWAITPEPGDTRVFDQYTTDAYTAEGLRGKVAFITGIRADESIMRFRASVNKLGVDSYINASSSKRVSLCKPIYDWAENDIFKYLGESEIAYAPVYDRQLYAGHALRVSTPLHAEHAKTIGKLRQVDPRFYDAVLKVFPEMAVQDRYWSQLDRASQKAEWGASFETVEQFVRTQIEDPAQRAKALKMFRSVMVRARKDPESYPPDHLFTYFNNGAFKRELLPLGRADKARRRARLEAAS